MKYLIIFLIGAASGVYAYIYFIESPRTTAHASAPVESEKTTANSSTANSDKALNTATIKDELSRTGQVVRRKAVEVGHSIASATHRARIVAVINAKYTLDRDLSSRAISVDLDNSKVTLRGKVANADLIARAITLALDTDGVSEVVSQLTVE